MEKEIINKMTKVCICKSVSKQTMIQAVENGCNTVIDVWKETSTGDGSCKGRRCGPKIQEIIDNHKNL